MSKMKERDGFLEVEDLDMTGWTGYTVSKGKTVYYILEREIRGGEFTGNYVRKKISKVAYEGIRKKIDA